MALPASFDPTLSTEKDDIRLRLGDTASPFYLLDATINAKLNQYGFDEACAQLAEGLASYFAQQAMLVVQRNLRRQYTNRSEFYLTLAKDIRNNLAQVAGESVPAAFNGQMAGPSMQDYLLDFPIGDPNAPNSLI